MLSSYESCDTAEPPGPSTYSIEVRGRGHGRGRGRGMGHPAHGYPPPGWSMAMPTPRIRPFREKSGPQHNIPFDAPELDFLLAVLGRNFFADMATLTNAYAVVHGGRLWADTTEDEIRFFFGILILMGVNERPQYRDYWSTDPALNCPYISSRITRNRFEQLMHCIHVTDPATEDRADKLGKVRPFLVCLRLVLPCQSTRP